MKPTKKLLFFLVAAVWFSTPPSSGAQQGAPTTSVELLQTRLGALEEEISTADVALKKLKEEQSQLLTQIEELNTRVANLTTSRGNLLQERAYLEKQLAGLEVEVRNIAATYDELKRAARARFRTAYVRSQEPPLLPLFSATNTDDLFRLAVYSERVRRSDQDHLTELKRTRSELIERKAALDQTAQNRSAIQAALLKEEEALRVQVSEQQSASRRLQNQQRESETLVLRLRAQRLRLQAVLTSLTQGNVDDAASMASAAKFNENPATRKVGVSSFDGQGLGKKKTVPLRPVEGKILKQWGEKSLPPNPAFDHGILFAAEAGEPIHAIAAGKVVWIGVMPTYGNVVLIDHGERYYSLLAKVGRFSVSRLDQVEPGEEIAKAPDGAKSIYFEVRKGGKPVNPNAIYQWKLR